MKKSVQGNMAKYRKGQWVEKDNGKEQLIIVYSRKLKKSSKRNMEAIKIINDRKNKLRNMK